ncbi:MULTISPECIES: NAD(P)/FAD-dependent oxidoreductase [unclassified Streptomyces]|uniref:FAD-dependent oxidoreductase n=1 Tax=unclassified Streptomyces TaxID=2593676 RepID=UPI001F03B7B4|nr:MULTISPECIES: NAD(P)/FAD-dependent oxidoreductase [unclassified Streptomyces]MCH0563861.1 FAD-dependent monooxygenase [Streptomyces sp. MUM 2J]MCH0571416.1 FAD-dependent monooxygenase [Streptomyces sp. MUM 136J]
MRTTTDVATQLRLAREDPMRLLIIGAGVAGVTVARLLRARGLHPLLVERADPGGEDGYMLGLMPFVDPVLRELGVHDRYLESSVGMHRYSLHGASGTTLKDYSLDEAIGRFGHYRGIERGRLLDVLGIGTTPVAYRTAITALHQETDRVHVTLTEQGRPIDLEFDAVIAADGLRSATRSLLLDPGRVHAYDTGWGGWVAWTEADDDADAGRYEEVWGAGSFIGLYPVLDRVGVFVGGPHEATAEGPAAFAERVRRTLRTLDGRCVRALRAVAGTPDAYYWNMSDVRASSWTTGRVALLGDAAAGFLPTAGVGAAMAMESAAVLAGKLGTSGTASIPSALSAYERVQRPRVETAQNNSRQLARLMFRRGRLITTARDTVTRFVGVNTALGPIRTLLAQRSPSTS